MFEIPNQEKPRISAKKLIAVQVVIVLMLTIFVGYKLNKRINYQGIANSISNMVVGRSFSGTGMVAGMYTTRYDIPEKIDITIDDRTKQIDTKELGFRFNQTPPTQSSENVFDSLFGANTEKTNQSPTYLVIDEAKFEYWLISKFGDMESGTKKNAEIKYLPNTTLILECVKGHGATKLPIREVIDNIKSYTQIPSHLKYNLQYAKLSEEEERINLTCESIDNFKAAVKSYKVEETGTTKETPFLEDHEINEVFGFEVVDGGIKISIQNQGFLESKLKEFKSLIDPEASDFNYRVIGNEFVVFGEYKPSQMLNVDNTVKQLQEALKKPQEIKSFPFAFDELTLDEGMKGLTVQKYTTLVSKGVLRYSVSPLDKATQIQNAIKSLDGVKINPGEKFALSSHLPKETEMTEIFVEDGKTYRYSEKYLAIATVLYRAILESGIQIDNRAYNLKSNIPANYGYPYNDLNIATAPLYIYNESEQSDWAIAKDFEFTNSTGSPLVLISESRVGNDGNIYFDLSVYSTQDFKKPTVALKNFEKTPYSSEGENGVTEKFVRVVNGKEETLLTNYVSN